MKHNYLYSLSLLLMAAVVTGCVKRELDCITGESVKITFDWSHLPDSRDIPPAMELRFYGNDGTCLFSQQSSSDVFCGWLPAGKYRVLIYNPDAIGMAFYNMESYADAQIWTLPQQENDGPHNQPEYPRNAYGLSIGELSVHTGQRNDTTVIPLTYTRNIILQLEMNGYTEELAECSATIGGLSQALSLSTGLPAGSATASVSTRLQPDNNAFKGSFHVLGNDKDHPNILTLQFMFADGFRKTLTKDVTASLDKLNKQPAGHSLIIKLTADVNMDGMFELTLTDWIGRDEDIYIH